MPDGYPEFDKCPKCRAAQVNRVRDVRRHTYDYSCPCGHSWTVTVEEESDDADSSD